jgi:hypothetical protein
MKRGNAWLLTMVRVMPLFDHIFAKKEDGDKFGNIRLITIWFGTYDQLLKELSSDAAQEPMTRVFLLPDSTSPSKSTLPT